jgi:hypothetical protein
MKTPAIIDIEASGFGKYGYPIEVGFITENANTWCSLIQPADDWQYWDMSAENVHHISRESLFRHGKKAAFIATQLNEHLKDMVVYSDGWAHDYVWMHKLFEEANLSPTFKLEDLRYALNTEQEKCWHTAKAQVIQETNATRHRASTDAQVLQLTWLKTRAASSS